MALDDHQKIIEVVRDTTGEAADGFHFLCLAQLIFEKLALADVLRNDEIDGTACVFEAMGDDFGVDDLAVFANVLPIGFRREAAGWAGGEIRGKRHARARAGSRQWSWPQIPSSSSRRA